MFRRLRASAEPQLTGTNSLLSLLLAAFCLFVVVGLSPMFDTGFARAAELRHTTPDFSGYWARPESGGNRIFYSPESGPGPIMNTDATTEFKIGDFTNSILLPHAAEAVKAHGDQGRAGQVLYPAWSLCWPSGVPLVLILAEPVQFLQTEDQVTILYQRGQQIRRIYLDQAHPENVRPSWYGDSIGHYEGSNTLVVDTIAQDTRSVVDRFATPKSEAIHVVERYTLSDDRQRIDVTFTVEDPNTFTTAWSARTGYVWLPSRRGFTPDREKIAEIICTENNRNAQGGDFLIPIDDTPDY